MQSKASCWVPALVQGSPGGLPPAALLRSRPPWPPACEGAGVQNKACCWVSALGQKSSGWPPHTPFKIWICCEVGLHVHLSLMMQQLKDTFHFPVDCVILTYTNFCATKTIETQHHTNRCAPMVFRISMRFFLFLCLLRQLFGSPFNSIIHPLFLLIHIPSCYKHIHSSPR